MGRATRGAALAMLLKVNLYVKDYDTARTWGAELLKMGDEEGEYSLCPNYEDNFTLAGENGPDRSSRSSTWRIRSPTTARDTDTPAVR